jgi:hypothetical protein
VAPKDDRRTFTVRYAGPTAEYYKRLSAIRAAPEVVLVTANEIIAVEHQTLRAWLADGQSPVDKARMAEQIRDLLQRVHEEVGLCHRDVHLRNIVLTDESAPLLIDPALCAEAQNSYCYDLHGPEPSGVAVYADHLATGKNGVWWGSEEKHDSLESAFGPWPR